MSDDYVDETFELEQAKKGHTHLKLYVHSFPAAYILYHEGSNKFYVGSTRNMYDRIRQHRNSLRAGLHRTTAFQEAYDENKNKNLRVKFFRTSNRDHAYDIEQELLNRYLPTGKLFNTSPDARVSNKNVTPSPRVREILRRKTLDRFKDPEERNKLSEIGKKIWQNPKYREQQKKGMARVRDQINQALKISTKKMWQTPEIREKFLKARVMRRKKISIEGVIYESIRAASSKLRIPESTIIGRLRNSNSFKTTYFYVEGTTENGTKN